MTCRLLLTCLILLVATGFSRAGDDDRNPGFDKIRVLFLLDGSFSMKETWQTRSKFEIAGEVLLEQLEESFANNPNKYFAVRVFGHQSGMNTNDCQDTRLEVPFEQRNLSRIRGKLEAIYPSGWSPIALSLERAAEDFPPDDLSFNVIIFITDGGETCYGDPCAAARKLWELGIQVTPFVIGLGRSSLLEEDVGCIGQYQQVSSEAGLRKALNDIIEKVDKRTTAQVYFRDSRGNRSETNIPFSFVNQQSPKGEGHFVHALNQQVSDTVELSILGKYELIAHTTPELRLRDLPLVENRHNTYEMNAPRGYLDLQLNGFRGFADFECLVRDMSSNLINVQSFDRKVPYLAGKYQLEITSRPRILLGEVVIEPNDTLTIEMSRSGTLLVESEEAIIGGVYSRQGKQYVKVEELDLAIGFTTVHLQPGEYRLIYNSHGRTMEEPFSITMGRVYKVAIDKN